MAEQGDMGGVKTLAPILLITGFVAAGAAAAIVIPVANGMRSDVSADVREIRESVADLVKVSGENGTNIAVLDWVAKDLASRVYALEGQPAIADTGAGELDNGG